MREFLLLLALIALVAVGGFLVHRHIEGLEAKLVTVAAERDAARTQTKIETQATQAEAAIAVRERVIVREVSNGQADIEAASSLGREAVLAAWVSASRRMRGEPDAAPAAAPGDPSVGA